MADFDASVIGAGCAGSVAAVELARAGKSVLLVERGENGGSKNMTGGRIYTHSLKKVFPNFEEEAPLERKVTHELISFLTDDAATTMEYATPKLADDSVASYTVLRAEFDAWLAGKAEEEGAECVFGMTVDDLLWDGNRVTGVSVGGDEITAEVTIIADGANSLLTEKAHLATTPKPHQMAVGAKEVISLSEQVISDRFRCAAGEGAAWLFVGAPTKGHAGGGFLYANKNSISLGMVATLSDLQTSDVPFSEFMNDFKANPLIAPLIEGGKTVEYSAHLVPEGGLSMVPELVGNGCLVAGDAGMLCVNLGYQVRGMDYAIASGSAAGRAAVAAIDAGDTSAAGLAGYKSELENSFVLKDLRSYQKVPAFMEQTKRMYSEYPSMVCEMMHALFAVDGEPVEPLKKKMMRPVKSRGLFSVLKEMKKGVDAL